MYFDHHLHYLISVNVVLCAVSDPEQGDNDDRNRRSIRLSVERCLPMFAG